MKIEIGAWFVVVLLYFSVIVKGSCQDVAIEYVKSYEVVLIGKYTNFGSKSGYQVSDLLKGDIDKKIMDYIERAPEVSTNQIRNEALFMFKKAPPPARGDQYEFRIVAIRLGGYLAFKINGKEQLVSLKQLKRGLIAPLQ
jgi:hypothetical protein